MNRIIFNSLENKVHLIRNGIRYDADIVYQNHFLTEDDGSIAFDDNGSIKYETVVKIAFTPNGFFENELKERGVTINDNLVNDTGCYRLVNFITFHEAFMDDSTFEYHNVL